MLNELLIEKTIESKLIKLYKKKKEMLTDALKAMVNNPFKESFYGKKRKEKKRKAINVLTTFFISHKSGVKTSLKLIVNHCPKRTC